jgi:hypothetical protein
MIIRLGIKWTTRDGTKIIRRYKNKNIYKGLVPLVPAVPANYTIPGPEFFGQRATYGVCILKTRRPIGELPGTAGTAGTKCLLIILFLSH